MDEEGFERACIKEKRKRRGIHPPFCGTWAQQTSCGDRMQKSSGWEMI